MPSQNSYDGNSQINYQGLVPVLVLWWLQARMLFSCEEEEGIWRRLGVQPDTAAPWNMTQGWMEAFRPVSVFPHVVLLFFICPSPNKTRTVLSDTLTLAEQTRLCQSHSLPAFKKQAFIGAFSSTLLEKKVLTRTIQGSSACPPRRTFFGSW